ncbi:ZP4 protein, partial [Polypterus senegalus]
MGKKSGKKTESTQKTSVPDGLETLWAYLTGGEEEREQAEAEQIRAGEQPELCRIKTPEDYYRELERIATFECDPAPLLINSECQSTVNPTVERGVITDWAGEEAIEPRHVWDVAFRSESPLQTRPCNKGVDVGYRRGGGSANLTGTAKQCCYSERCGTNDAARNKTEQRRANSQEALCSIGSLRLSQAPDQTGNPKRKETTGDLVKVTKNLPGIGFRSMFGFTTLTVFLSPWYGYVSAEYYKYKYVVTIALGRPNNWKTYTCPLYGPRLVSAERCTVAESQKLPCGGSSSITQADCVANNCCYDSSSSTSPCYYANDVTVQCTQDGQFVVVVSENVTHPSLDLGSIQLVDSSSPSCSPVTSLSSFVMYQFPVSACGSTVQLAGGNVTYQNTMSAAITVRTGPVGSITRDSVFKLFFQCTYSGSQDVQVEAEVYTVGPPLPVVEQGPFDLELVIATDSSYGSYYVDADYPVTKTLRDPVAVEVHIMNRTDPNLVLTLGDCWVTPGPSASSQPQWSLLVNGCPNTGDNYLTNLVTVDSTSGIAYPSHYKRFVFEMFAFVDPVTQQALAEKIFIYCVAAACYPSAADPVLELPCTKAADKLAQIASSRKNVLLHSGPVVFGADQVTTSRLEQEASLPTGFLVLGAAAAMLMVVLVLAVVALRRLNRHNVNLKF